jgi:hypothetical protein
MSEGEGEGGFCLHIESYPTLFDFDIGTVFAFDIYNFDILTFRHIYFGR